MSRRDIKRIDYRELNSTGNITYLEENLSSQISKLSIHDSPLTMPNDVPSDNAIDLMVMSQEVMDIIDESPINDMVAHEVNIVISKLGHLRTSMRKKQVKVNSSKEQLTEEVRISVNHTILSIKDFIKSANDGKAKLKLRQDKAISDKAALKEKTISFILDCNMRSIQELSAVFSFNFIEATSEQLLNWRKELSLITNKFEQITDSYKECLGTPITNADILIKVQSVGEKYTQLKKAKQKYVMGLTSEINSRELDKHAEFKKSRLNIKIEKFSGYDATTDFYGFLRTNFEKMHLDSTPKELLSDLIINSYRKDPALTMVKNLSSIDEIWNRLREAYGDTKILLTKRLQHLRNRDLNKKDPEKLVNGLS